LLVVTQGEFSYWPLTHTVQSLHWLAAVLSFTRKSDMALYFEFGHAAQTPVLPTL
jgi:hypothetical protein